MAPYQLHRFIELMKEMDIDFSTKFAAQVSTSMHFYDTTAHRFIKENCLDMQFKYAGGLSAKMEDLLEKQGQKEALDFFKKLMFDVKHNIYQQEKVPVTIKKESIYEKSLPIRAKKANKQVTVITNVAADDLNLRNMIDDFVSAMAYEVKVFNVREFAFTGGCISCFRCTIDGTCIYKDGFQEVLRNEICTSDAIVYAYTIENHFTHSSMKCYDDRQFCNGHRPVNRGKCTGYIISGSYSQESNLRVICEARAEVSGMYNAGVATDELDTALSINQLAKSLSYSLDHNIKAPANFYGVGGMKVFRDLIYVMKGFMKEDHRFYKSEGMYDFPQKETKKIAQMYLVGAAMAIPSIQKKIMSNMNEYTIEPYRRLIASAEQRNKDKIE